MAETESLHCIELPSGATVDVVRQVFGSKEGPRIVFVAGIRGDTPEGIRLAHRLGQFLATCEKQLKGRVEIFPCVNPLAAEQGMRKWPFFNVDLNRLFPGKMDGHPPSQVAFRLVEEVKGADFVIELRGARPGFSEIPQALVREGDEKSSQIAQWGNVQLVWERKPGLVAKKTFAYQFPHTIILEGGRGNQLTKGVGEILFEGCLHILSRLEVLPEDLLPFPWMTIEEPITKNDESIFKLRSNRAGLFLPAVSIGAVVEEGSEIGKVIDPANGSVREVIISPEKGRMIAVRIQPVVSAGVMVARLCGGQ